MLCGSVIYYVMHNLYRLIEEFMLLANMTVARVTSAAFPDSAMLRRHPKPKERAAALLVTRINIIILLLVSCNLIGQ